MGEPMYLVIEQVSEIGWTINLRQGEAGEKIFVMTDLGGRVKLEYLEGAMEHIMEWGFQRGRESEQDD